MGMSILQKQYFNVDLQALRDEVTQIKQMSNEKIQDFYGRVHHLCSLASKNFETQYRQIWVEQQVRDRIYRNLDQTNRIEIDTLETTHNVKMSSKEIVQTVIDRNNFRMNPIKLEEDVLCNISRVNLQNELKLPLLERRSPTTYEVEKQIQKNHHQRMKNRRSVMNTRSQRNLKKKMKNQIQILKNRRSVMITKARRNLKKNMK